MTTMFRIAINRMATGKLPQGDPRWEAFNTSFENVELPRIDIANAIYTGHSYAAWHNGRRKTENFVCAQHIAIDMDTGDERSSIEHLSSLDFIRIYGGLIHTTPSHTPEAPRARVLFFLDDLITEPKAFTSAARFLIAQFEDADPACKDASRFFYGAMKCDIWLSYNVLPLAHLRRYHRKWKQAQARPQATQQQPQYSAPSQKPFRSQPYQQADTQTELQMLSEALSHIDPWSVSYDKWIGILAAIHDEMGDVGLGLAERWGQGQPGEIGKKWKTFGNFAGEKMTLGTIYHLAKQNSQQH